MSLALHFLLKSGPGSVISIFHLKYRVTWRHTSHPFVTTKNKHKNVKIMLASVLTFPHSS